MALLFLSAYRVFIAVADVTQNPNIGTPTVRSDYQIITYNSFSGVLPSKLATQGTPHVRLAMLWRLLFSTVQWVL
jgi:hypothetical protein